ncbi:MAG: hypothetical protein ACYST9_03665, partial [Planctomycetota bacterium]
MEDTQIRGLSDLYFPEKVTEEVVETGQTQNENEEEQTVEMDSQQSEDSVDQEQREETVNYNFDEVISDMTDVEVVADEQKDFKDLEKMAGQSPVIKFVNYLISDAIQKHASDIHIEPKDKVT